MSKSEFNALNELVHDHSLTIKPAYKGGSVVVMDMSQYVAEASRQISDENVYRKLSSDPSRDFERKI